jgi:hypothetical protein
MTQRNGLRPRFNPGQIFTTPGAWEALGEDLELATMLLARHVSGDWGDVCPEDRGLNNEALRLGGRLMSVYKLPMAETVWLITEADRQSTTVLLPAEY